MSGSLLLFMPELVTFYALFVNRKVLKKGELAKTVKNSVTGIVPVAIKIFFAYCTSNLFSATNVGVNIGEFIKGWNLLIVTIVFILPLITAVFAMMLPGSAQTKIFGTIIITVFANTSRSPLLAAVMFLVITGAMEGMTPSIAFCMYTTMGIARSKFKETTLNCLIWVGLHYALAVICLLGYVIGLIIGGLDFQDLSSQGY